MIPDLRMAKFNKNKAWAITGGITIGTVIVNYLVQKGINVDPDIPAFIGQISTCAVTFYAVSKSFMQANKRTIEYNQTKTDISALMSEIGHRKVEIPENATKQEINALTLKQQQTNANDIFKFYLEQPGVHKIISNDICVAGDDSMVLDTNEDLLDVLYKVQDKIRDHKLIKKHK